MAITKVKPSELSDATAAALAARIRKDVFLNQPNVFGYVSEWADLPLGDTDDDPEVGDFVGVNTETGTWILGTLRRKGLYKRVALTGTRAEQYGTSPYSVSPDFIETTGDLQYTEENIVASDETITESIDKLDMAMGDMQEDIEAISQDRALVGINNQDQTTYTLAVSDAGKAVRIANANAITLTVPKNSVIAIPVNSVINVCQSGAGRITIAPVDGDVTLNKFGGLKSVGQYGYITLIKIDTNIWDVIGGIE
jgi:hypothetical protein